MSAALSSKKCETHTPTPWGHDDFDEAAKLIKAGEVDGVAIFGADGSEIAAINHSPEDGFDLVDDRAVHKANAAFIVRAVNSHDDLLAALKVARTGLAIYAPETGALKQIDAAIAKAEATS